MKKFFILFFVLFFYKIGMCGSWGGTAWQNHADSVKMAHIRLSSSTLNFGGSTQNIVGTITSTTDTFSILLKPINDLTPVGASYDSLVWHLFWDLDGGNSHPSGRTDESLYVGVFPLRRAWGEGVGNSETTVNGECDWVDAIQATATWGTAGAKNTSSDIYPIVDTLIMRGVNSTQIGWRNSGTGSFTTIGDGGEITIRITGSNVYSAVTNGVLLKFVQDFGGYDISASRWNTDNDGTSGLRPYPVLYYTLGWGGRAVFQFADSVKGTNIQSATDNNYGAAPTMYVTPQGAASPSHILLQPAIEKRTPGATQDSAKIYMYNDATNSTPLTGDDTMYLMLYGLRKSWGEGTGGDGGAAANSGESDWNHAQHTSLSWGTAGATNAADRFGPLDTFALTPGWWAGGTDSAEVVFTIVGTAVDSLFTYGVYIEGNGINGAPNSAWVFVSDNGGSGSIKKPWFQGWETVQSGKKSIFNGLIFGSRIFRK